MDKNIYEKLINELKVLNRPDFEIEEVGYFWNELVILKKEKMPMENIEEEIVKFQRIVIDNNLTSEDEEEMFEDLSKKQQKPVELMEMLKQESYYTPEELDQVNTNISFILAAKDADTLSELELYKFNAEQFKKDLEAEKEEMNYESFDYVTFLTSKIKAYEIN